MPAAGVADVVAERRGAARRGATRGLGSVYDAALLHFAARSADCVVNMRTMRPGLSTFTLDLPISAPHHDPERPATIY